MTSNRPLEEWDKPLGDVPTAGAILDRFLYHTQCRCHFASCLAGSRIFSTCWFPSVRFLRHRLPGTIRAGGFGPQQQSGASRLCKACFDEAAITRRLRAAGHQRARKRMLTILQTPDHQCFVYSRVIPSKHELTCLRFWISFDS
jgi:hypothetical protein